MTQLSFFFVVLWIEQSTPQHQLGFFFTSIYSPNIYIYLYFINYILYGIKIASSEVECGERSRKFKFTVKVASTSHARSAMQKRTRILSLYLKCI